MSSINRATLAKEIDGVIEYIYPKTSADLVEYTDSDNTVMTVEDKLHSINTTTGSLDSNFSNYYTKTQSDTMLDAKLDDSQLVTSQPSAESTDAQISSAKAVYNALNSLSTNVNDNYYTKTQANGLLDAKLDDTQLVTAEPSSSSTDTQIPSAKAVYTALNTLASDVDDNYYTKAEADEAFYVAIVIDSASLSKTTFEQGDTSNATTLTWKTNTLAASAKVSVAGGTAVETISSGKKNSGTYAATIDTSTVNSNGSKSVAVKLDITDAFEGTATRSVNATVCNKIFWGGKADATIDEAFIEGLSGSALQASKAKSSFTCAVSQNQYFFYAVPHAYGTPSFNINGFPTSLDKVGSSVNVSNQFGSTVAYDVYRIHDIVSAAGGTTYTIVVS